MIAPKYRTDLTACSCPGFWYRRSCKHYRAYREAVSLLETQNAVNLALGYPKGRKRRCTGLSEGHLKLCESNAGHKSKWRHFGARSTPSLRPIGR